MRKRWMMLAVLVLSLVATSGRSAEPGPGSASSGNWIDKLTDYVLMQKAVSKHGDYDSYLYELRLAKEARQEGNWQGQYQALNRFIDILDHRLGGVSEDSARAIREYTYLVEPPGFHDLVRDRMIHPEVQKWAERRARARAEGDTLFNEYHSNALRGEDGMPQGH